jgi:whirlin
MNHYLRNCFEAEDIPDVPSYYDRSRLIGTSTGSLCALNGINSLPSSSHHYYSLENSSYSVLDRPRSPRYYTSSFTSSRERDSFCAPSRSKRFYYDPLTFRSQNGQKRITRSTDQMHHSSSLIASQSNYQQHHYNHSNGRISPPYTSTASSSNFLHRNTNSRDRTMITRTVTMTRDLQPDGSHGFGICVKGGIETGVGVFISRVEEGSIAERVGLCPGYTIVEVNGTSFSGMTHEKALAVNFNIL